MLLFRPQSRHRFRKVWCRFCCDQSAAIAVETALASIVLATLIMGGFEAGRVVLLEQKLDRVSSTVSDLVARKKALTTADLNDIYDAARTIMKPFDLNAQGTVYISVVKPGTPTGFAWQRKLGGMGIQTSKLGSPATNGGKATLPAGFTLKTNEYVVVAETYYAYSPLMAFNMFTARTVYQASFNRPRLAEWPALQ